MYVTVYGYAEATHINQKVTAQKLFFSFKYYIQIKNYLPMQLQVPYLISFK